MNGLIGNGTFSNMMMNHGAFTFYSGIQSMHIFVGVLTTEVKRRVGVRVLADAYITLSTSFMDPKLHCEKLRHCLSE